jgi:putative ATP-dependent endonuclease of OLD family
MYLSKMTVHGMRAGAEGELVVELPGRFSVLAGANSSGKTTFCDAAYLVHPETFPSLPRLSAASLGAGGLRRIDVEYRLEDAGRPEGPLGNQALAFSGSLAAGQVVSSWGHTLTRSLGAIRSHWDVTHDLAEHMRLIYLPAHRNPLDELARREARILVELLRAQQQRLDGTRNLTGLRTRAWQLLESLSREPLIEAVEERVTAHLSNLTAGVSRQWPYVRGQRVDDAYLARVLELMLSVLEGRRHARPLEVTGLGYVNLLHIAVTLAAIPDPSQDATISPAAATVDAGVPPSTDTGPTGADPEDVSELELAQAELVQAREESELQQDSFFPQDPFHATVIIEEPEAHLHPQLQHALVRHLRRTVLSRPELQVVLSSHAPDVLTSARPEDVVVLRRLADGRRVSRVIAHIPMNDKPAVLRKARLHLDATRSASLFAERLVLVEGVTEVALVREFAWVWAGADERKQAFTDALTIIAMGTRVGNWPVRLLATRDHEIAKRIAVLSDSDKALTESPTDPAWATDHDPSIVRVFHSHPTLEPAITLGNENLVQQALAGVGVTPPAAITIESITAIFAGRKAPAEAPPTPAGAAASKKAEFALSLAELILQARESAQPVQVPAHLNHLFEFLYAEPDETVAVGDQSPLTPTPPSF